MANFTIVSAAPSVGNIPVETKDFEVLLGRIEDGPLGYVVRNKATDVIEHVARRYAEAVGVMESFQRELDTLVQQAPAPAGAVPIKKASH